MNDTYMYIYIYIYITRCVRHRVTADMIGSVVRTSDPAQACMIWNYECYMGVST